MWDFTAHAGGRCPTRGRGVGPQSASSLNEVRHSRVIDAIVTIRCHRRNRVAHKARVCVHNARLDPVIGANVGNDRNIEIQMAIKARRAALSVAIDEVAGVWSRAGRYRGDDGSQISKCCGENEISGGEAGIRTLGGVSPSPV